MTDNHIDVTALDLVIAAVWSAAMAVSLVAFGYCLAQLIQGQL